MTQYRIELDTMGEVKVPANALWGAQTERSRNNFKIGPEGSMPLEIIRAFGILKKSAARTNRDFQRHTSFGSNFEIVSAAFGLGAP